MIFPIIFAVVISTVNALTVQEQWTQFKDKHGKIYKTIIEEKYRFEIFQNNLKTINEHNAKYEDGLKTYQMGVNQFADLTSLEFGALFNRQIGERPTIHESLHVQSGTAPDSIDWREKNAVLEVKNQGSCGSCWAFSATGSIEGQNVLINNKSVSLSEQQLVDCTKEYGNYGCDGGWMENSFKFVIENGLVAEKDYPYTARQGQCKKPTTDSITIKGYKKIPQSEAALKDAVGTVGPISVLIYGDYLRFYKQGIFYEVGCVSDESYLDHAVLIVGYGIYQDEDNKGEKYWLVKNLG